MLLDSVRSQHSDWQFFKTFVSRPEARRSGPGPEIAVRNPPPHQIAWFRRALADAAKEETVTNPSQLITESQTQLWTGKAELSLKNLISDGASKGNPSQ
jgi:hypothetical protein